MTKVLLAVHVLAAIIAIGPVTVAASMFPAVARRAASGNLRELTVLRALHRICAVSTPWSGSSSSWSRC